MTMASMFISRNAWWWLVGLGTPLLIVAWLLVAGILQVARVQYVKSRCTSCTMVTEMLYYRISVRRWGVEIPYNMHVYGGAPFCPHTLVYP